MTEDRATGGVARYRSARNGLLAIQQGGRFVVVLPLGAAPPIGERVTGRLDAVGLVQLEGPNREVYWARVRETGCTLARVLELFASV
jgi:hypothetical protein